MTFSEFLDNKNEGLINRGVNAISGAWQGWNADNPQDLFWQNYRGMLKSFLNTDENFKSRYYPIVKEFNNKIEQEMQKDAQNNPNVKYSYTKHKV